MTTTVIYGGAGFVGLNIAERLLREGGHVVLFDRLPLPDAARAAFAALPGRFEMVTGDVTDADAATRVVTPGVDAVVLGAAITADAAREAREPERVLEVNLMSLPPVLRAARDAGVRRVVYLSSAAVYGQAAIGAQRLDESTPVRPVGLYGIGKQAAEQLVQRLAHLWQLDAVSLRLSAVFGPWERATGVRDTTSPQFQITESARAGEPALLSRPGVRDWIYAPDVAEAVALVAAAPSLRHALYNVSAPQSWPVLEWGRLYGKAAGYPARFACRVAAWPETPNIELHAATDRPPLSTHRLHEEFGWEAAHGMGASAAHLAVWCRDHAPAPAVIEETRA